jgi:hypothetical protein
MCDLFSDSNIMPNIEDSTKKDGELINEAIVTWA